jgi:hypothetical protein
LKLVVHGGAGHSIRLHNQAVLGTYGNQILNNPGAAFKPLLTINTLCL